MRSSNAPIMSIAAAEPKFAVASAFSFDGGNMKKGLLALTLLLAGVPMAVGAVSPELQRRVRETTFEVVLKKPPEGGVRYEKPLPVDLMPYYERTDPYRSIGTAFALGKNRYVTAAHVLGAAIDSQFGAPALRAPDGTIRPVANILQYAASEDFVVFSLAEDFNREPLPINRSPHVDDPVLAVGNALGEGIVIREGLFTSETPEDQDGRWKWIRFSAAASPGNSGGPLLDAAGDVIGVVIAKSPNENLNYALPIANVLDAPPSKARFDQRILEKLSYAQGSTTYVLKDEFTLPLSWQKFVRTYQSLLDRHNDEARKALLSSYASSMFPHGDGTDAILYGSETSRREPAMVTQGEDGAWTIQSPEMRFTELSGDGKVGVASIAGVALLSLHRGSDTTDGAFFTDSKAFMDVALKALNLRRVVGTDQVRVISLGPAVSDAATADRYGRIWQVRVWPIPFLDAYLIGQLLPTPDGYAAVLAYAPSMGLRETKIRLALLADQVTVTYGGTLAQWRAFLGHKALLPQCLKGVTLDEASGWTLHTHRFSLAIPPALLKLDAHSEVLMNMNYLVDGGSVGWDATGVWWYRDTREQAYVGLWRQPRPPSTAPVELRNRFEDIQSRRSPYDSAPVRASSDALDVSTGLQVPGDKSGMASSDVVYGLTMHVDGHPTPEQIAADQEQLLAGTHILERGAGQQVAVSAPATAAPLQAYLKQLEAYSKRFDMVGKDSRGRSFSDDVDQYITPLIQTAMKTPIGGLDGGAQFKTLSDRAGALRAYWMVAPTIVHDRDLWHAFLTRNHLADSTPHSADVLSAESSYDKVMRQAAFPTADWATQAKALDKAYLDERKRLANQAARTATNLTYHARTSPCPAPATQTSGKPTARVGEITSSLSEYYPRQLQIDGVEGLVVLSIKVARSGCETEAAVAGSSGSDDFDDAALRWVETATFLPAEKDGQPTDSVMRLGVAFALQ